MNGLKEHHQCITERMQQLMQQPSALGRDLLLEELRSCYAMVLTMPLTAETSVAEAPKPAPSPVVESVAAPSAVEIPITTLEPEPNPEPTTAPIAAPVVEETPTEADIPETAQPFIPVSQPSITETAPMPMARAEEPAPLPAAKSEKENNDSILAGKLNNKPIADLRSGIPLNEKFGIIRNLFAGNASDFGDAVLKLNSFETASELKQHFQFLTQRKNWDIESESYQVFQSYLERKASTLGNKL